MPPDLTLSPQKRKPKRRFADISQSPQPDNQQILTSLQPKNGPPAPSQKQTFSPKRNKYDPGTHGAKKSEQKRLNTLYKASGVRVTGDVFHSEHTIGFAPLAETADVDRGKGDRARTLENQAYAYQEQKDFHVDNIGTGNKAMTDESGFNSKTYRSTQRSLVKSGNVSAAVQINQLTYAFQKNFKKTPQNNREKTLREISNDSFNVMVSSMKKVTYAQEDENVTVNVSRRAQAEMYLGRRVAQTGLNPTRRDIEAANEMFETHKDWAE
jgi:hypothetical protein